eukprot:GABV01001737.1.p1 GENE.GABV01001737.1~~GABV01001737.1.p1  ORF type:complete len:184 (+),score=43.96 GABV01001737.1:249-800(+)
MMFILAAVAMGKSTEMSSTLAGDSPPEAPIEDKSLLEVVFDFIDNTIAFGESVTDVATGTTTAASNTLTSVTNTADSISGVSQSNQDVVSCANDLKNEGGPAGPIDSAIGDFNSTTDDFLHKPTAPLTTFETSFQPKQRASDPQSTGFKAKSIKPRAPLRISAGRSKTQSESHANSTVRDMRC